MLEAKYYNQLDNEKVECVLCPHNCIISEGEYGICQVRKNTSGFLFSANYKKISSIATDPIEKKPLYHFMPGTEILSIGSYGCNFKCNFCQNHQISQAPFQNFNRYNFSLNDILMAVTSNKNSIGIAFTYNEPVVWIEYVLEIANAIDKSYKKVLVTNGFINPEPLADLIQVIDAFNVDLKAFDSEFYKKNTAGNVEPVKHTLKQIKKSGKHLEITNLVIPGQNDNPQTFERMVNWIATELGKDTPLHISKYFPQYKSTIAETPTETLLEFHQIASKYLNFVYLGNLPSTQGQNTYCPNCGAELICRTGYYTILTQLNENQCGNCNALINVV